jgi:hypothetical protein
MGLDYSPVPEAACGAVTQLTSLVRLGLIATQACECLLKIGMKSPADAELLFLQISPQSLGRPLDFFGSLSVPQPITELFEIFVLHNALECQICKMVRYRKSCMRGALERGRENAGNPKPYRRLGFPQGLKPGLLRFASGSAEAEPFQKAVTFILTKRLLS